MTEQDKRSDIATRIARVGEGGRFYDVGDIVTIVHTGRDTGRHDITEQLRVPSSTPLYVRARSVSRVIDGTETVIGRSTSWFSPDVVAHAPRLTSLERIEGGTTRYVAQVLNLSVVYVSTEIHPCLIDPDRDKPGLMTRTTVSTNTGTVIEYGESVNSHGVEVMEKRVRVPYP